MGYFSNGTEGDAYEADHCHKCTHYVDGCCAVLDIHRTYNYDQFPEHERTADAKRMATALRFVLGLLIPRSKDGIGNDQCKMFHPKQEDDGK